MQILSHYNLKLAISLFVVCLSFGCSSQKDFPLMELEKAPTKTLSTEEKDEVNVSNKIAQTNHMATLREPTIPVVPNLKEVVGKTKKSIHEIFGAPSFTRLDPPALLWQYRSAVCTLDLFLYQGEIDYQYEYFEIRYNKALAGSHKSCLHTLVHPDME